jgi:hypothetical protein
MDKLFEIRAINYRSGEIITNSYYIRVGRDGKMDMSRVTAELSTQYQILSIKPIKEM